MLPQGLSLSRRFFESALPSLRESIPDILSCSAAGLVGEGSDCLGLDDSISRDHDWGPAFCLWIPDETLSLHTRRIEQAMTELPETFEGFRTRMKPDQSMGRTGPLPLRGFYRRFLGMNKLPEHWKEWRSIPEYHLCSCTNGEVFLDNTGEFTSFREALLAYYPADVRRKKIAARCMIMAQAGQYNLPRCLSRGDSIAAMLAAARFSEAALSMVFLLNKRYMPFYKWAGRMVQHLPILGGKTAALLRSLAETPWSSHEQAMSAVDSIETFCALVAMELRDQHLTNIEGSWLWALGPSIQKEIKDQELRSLNVMED